MLEVVIPGTRHGRGVMNSDSAYRGNFCYIAGVNAEGYQLLQLPYDSAQAVKAQYPVNKYYFEEDLSDTSDAIDKLSADELIVYYEGGEYITDKFDQTSLGLDSEYWSVVEGGLSSSYGNKLYVPGSSTAQATTGLDKLYVSTGVGRGAVGQLTASNPEEDDIYVGFTLGVHYTDSSDAKLHFRIHPNTNWSEVAKSRY